MKKGNIVRTLSMSIFMLGLAACNTGNANADQKNTTVGESNGMAKKEITLTQDEIKRANNNPNAIAQFLVRDAVLNKASTYKYTDEQKKALETAIEDAKKNVEVEFYLQTVIAPNVKVQDSEVLEVYKNNHDKLGNKDIKEVAPALAQTIYNYKYGAQKSQVLNGIIKEYNLNETLKKYVPEDVLKAQQAAAQQNVQAQQQAKQETSTDKKVAEKDKKSTATKK